MSETSAHLQPVSYNETEHLDRRRKALQAPREKDLALANAYQEIKKLRELAYTDSLTGLPNRLAFDTEFPELIEVAKRNGARLALGEADVKGLKRANDNEGHPTGDKLLQSVSGAFEGLLRPGDVVGRLGGDEFFFILLDYSPMPGQTVEELNKTREDSIEANFVGDVEANGIDPDLHVGIRVSITVMEPGDTAESMYKRVDKLLKDKKDAEEQAFAEQGIVFEDSRLL
jgi:diguanylate cyclase (GGDEF)-like protein